ncbi:MAG: iron ABC transporter permease [Acidimicrobiales bacterium]|nr:iron ABC transporter permease [Acidimicrobiales bacterium]
MKVASSSSSVRAPFGLTAVAVAIGLIFLGPFAYVVWRNIDLGTDLGSVVFDEDTLHPLSQSLRLGVAVAASAAAIGTALAWLTVRSDIPGRRVWRLLAPLPLVFPSFVGATALLAGFASGGLMEELLAPFGIETLPDMRGFRGAWLVLTLFTYPYVYLPVAARMASLPPSLEESARLLGRSPVAVFRTVVLPQASSAIWAGTLLVFLYAISDFGAVALLGYDTLTEQIFADKLFDQPRAMGLSLVLGAVALIVVIAERSLDRRRRRIEVVRSRESLVVPLGRWRWPAVAVVAGFLGNALVGPVAVLGFWAWRGMTADAASVGLATDMGDLVGPTLRSAEAGLITAAIAIVIVLPLAWTISRYRSRVAGVANSMVVAGFALPGVVIALSLVFWAIDAPLISRWYQTLPLLIIAYVLHFGAQATRAAQVAVDAVPRRLGDAAATLGAGRARRFFSVEVPLMRPGLLAGAGLVMLSTMKELPATLLLAPIGFDTLATEIWGAGDRGALAQGALASLMLVALSAVLTWAVVIRRIEHY